MKFFKSKISMIPIVHLFHPLGSSKHWRKTSDYTHFLLLSNIFDHSNDQATGCRQGFSLAETPGDKFMSPRRQVVAIRIIVVKRHTATLCRSIGSCRLSPNPTLVGNRKSWIKKS